MIENITMWLLDWAEVWALLIPLAVLVKKPSQPPYLKPVIAYLWIALLLNLAADLNIQLKPYLPDWAQSNNPLYNIHSVVRFVCFAAFFSALQQPFFGHLRKWLAVVSFVFLVLNFIYIDKFFGKILSGNLLSVEAYVLLVYCVLYYLSQLKEEVEAFASGPDFWVATGLFIYVVINFFVFLFYIPMFTYNETLAGNMWYVHNVAYIIFCCFIAKGFYVSAPTFARV